MTFLLLTDHGNPVLHVAVGMDDRKIVDMLLASGANVDIRSNSDASRTKGGTALHCAAYWAHDDPGKCEWLTLHVRATRTGIPSQFIIHVVDEVTSPCHRDAARTRCLVHYGPPNIDGVTKHATTN